MDAVVDIVVIGAGHNGLAAAGQLARAGYSVAVVEASDHVGGKAITTEPLIPGFRHHPHANVLAFADLMPGLAVMETSGLRAVCPEAQLGIAFADGRPPVILHRFDRAGLTVRSLSAYSPADGRTWRELKRRSAPLGAIIARGLYTSPNAAWFADQAEAVRRAFGDLVSPSTLGHRAPVQLVDELFRKPECRMLFYHLALEYGLSLDDPGGDLAFLGLVVWSAGRWRLPLGGMQSVSNAFARLATDEGVRIQLHAPVRKVLTRTGAAVGVELLNGSSLLARRAVVAAVPILDLFDDLIGPGDVAASEQVEIVRFKAGQAGSIGTSLFCLEGAPRYRSARHDEAIDTCLKTVVGHDSPADVLAGVRDAGSGLLPRPAGTVRINSIWDAHQAPDDRHVAGADSLFPPAPCLSSESWKSVEATFPDALLEVWRATLADPDSLKVLATTCDSTARFERRMLVRLGDDQYRTSVPGLYICGPGSFPGGGVHAACGINAARVVAQDLLISSGDRTETTPIVTGPDSRR